MRSPRTAASRIVLGLALAVVLRGAAVAAATEQLAGSGGDRNAPSSSTLDAAAAAVPLPPFTRVLLQFDGVEQEVFDRQYRLPTRLALIYAAGQEANRSAVVNVYDGDFEGAVAAAAARFQQAAAPSTAPSTAPGANGEHTTQHPAAAAAAGSTAGGSVQPPATPAPATLESAAVQPPPLAAVRRWLGLRSKLRRLLQVAPPAAAPAASTASVPAAAPASEEVAEPVATIPVAEASAAPAAPAAPADDAQMEEHPDASSMLAIEPAPAPTAAVAAYAIISQDPAAVVARLTNASSNFGRDFYARLHRYGVPAKPSLFVDGTPILGPAAEEANPAAYAAAAAAAGLTTDAAQAPAAGDAEPAVTATQGSTGTGGVLLSDEAELLLPAGTPHSAKVTIGASKGWDTAAAAAGATDKPAASFAKRVVGMPLWAFVPLVIVATLLAVAALVAAVLLCVRLARRRADKRAAREQFMQHTLVYGDALLLVDGEGSGGAVLPTAKALERWNNNSGGEGSKHSRDDDLHSVQTITSLQTGVTSSTVGDSTAAASNKPTVRAIRVPQHPRAAAGAPDSPPYYPVVPEASTPSQPQQPEACITGSDAGGAGAFGVPAGESPLPPRPERPDDGTATVGELRPPQGALSVRTSRPESRQAATD